MYYLIGIVQLIILCIFLYKEYKKEGILIFGDALKLTFMLWLLNISLYNLQFSKLYNPNWQINLICMLIALTFFILSKKFSLTKNDIKIYFREIKEEYSVYSFVSTVIFILSLGLFIYNINKYGLAILGENKIDKQQLDHYAGYIIYLLVLVAQIKYVLFRTNKKIIELVMFLISIVVLLLTLNRGALSYIAIAIFIYEVFNLVNIKERITTTKLYSIYGILIVGIIIGIVGFGYIGDMRMEYVLQNVYNRTINEHYQMPRNIPSGLLWVYIYLTSPLENTANSIINQEYGLTFFNNLFYPFIKFFANLFGKGDQYKEWLTSVKGFTPVLEKKVGLNATSFIPEAMQDLSYIGVIIYIIIFLALAYLAINSVKKRIRFTSIGSIVLYANVLSILMWSVFVNSLKIPMLTIYIIGIIAIEICIKLGIFRFFFKLFKRG